MDNQHRKISGYRDLTQQEIDMMNWFKDVEAEILLELDMAESACADPRWVSIARTDFQKAFMAAVRAIARPGEES